MGPLSGPDPMPSWRVHLQRNLFWVTRFSISNPPSENPAYGPGIHAEHLKHCSDILIPLLSKCFTGLLVHGTIPESMIDVVLVPIVKNKRASICSKANYRPIALASIVSKIFEKLLYDRISYALTTCSNQFGFKTKHSTDMCMLLKRQC